MSWVATAVVVGGTAFIAGSNTMQQASNQQKEAINNAADKEAAAYEKAQEALGKAKDEAITDIEASTLVAQGILTKAEAQQILSLNQAESGAIATIRNYEAARSQGLDTYEGKILKSLTDSGVLTRDQLTGAYLNSVKNITGAKDEAFKFLTGNSTGAMNAINKGTNESLVSILDSEGQTSPYMVEQDKNRSMQVLADRDAALQRYQETGNSADLEKAQAAQQEYIKSVTNLDKGIVKLQDVGIPAEKYIQDYAQLARQDINQFYDDAQKGLDPYTELGNRYVEQSKYLSGLMTDQEKATYESKFGGIQKSPLYEFQKKEAEEALQKQQLARGNFMSGQGLKEYQENVINRLGAQEAARQQEVAASGVQSGLAAQQSQAQLAAQRGEMLGEVSQQTGQTLGSLQSGRENLATSLTAERQNLLTNLDAQRQALLADIAVNTGANLATLGSVYGQNMANQYANEGLNQANVMQSFSGQRQGLASESAANIANTIGSFGSQRSATLGSSAANRATLASGAGTQKANARLGVASNQATLGAQGAQNAYNASVAAANANAQAQLAPVQLGVGLLNAGANIYGMSQGQMPQQTTQKMQQTSLGGSYVQPYANQSAWNYNPNQYNQNWGATA